jgi:hypothetical protein
VAVAWECRGLDDNGLTGPLPTELGTMDALQDLCVRRPHPPRLGACSVTGLWAERGGEGCRILSENGFTGLLPTELGTMDALIWLCVHRPHPLSLPGCGLRELRDRFRGRWQNADGVVQGDSSPCSGGHFSGTVFECTRSA